ncbi:MAG: non-homologous end-joining DNA ligase [Kibdelosporangium sp.]
MPGDLTDYRRKRDPARTPEPVPEAGVLPHGSDDTFVIQEHHARRLHWDVRLERGGVLASWAVPKGLPVEPGTIRLAVHTEDHPLEYATFEGEIPKGEYGAGTMKIWDRGTYETIKWADYEVDVILHGERVDGRYVFFRKHGKDGGEGGGDWMVRRSGAARDPDWEPLPDLIQPMLATIGTMPPAAQDDKWAYEFKWDGVRALVRVEGGRLQVFSRAGNEVTSSYPELAELGNQLGSSQAWLDGEIVAFADGRPSFAELQKRMHVSQSAQARKLAGQVPVSLLLFDLLHFEGRSLLKLPFADRRALLEKLGLRGRNWYTAPSYPAAGAAVAAASRAQGLEGVIAKRLDSRYQPGRSPAWLKITDVRPQEVVIGGWRPGEGRREGVLGALLLGVPEGDGLRFVGSVGTGFSDADLAALTARLIALERKKSPFNGKLPPERSRGARWVRPELVGEVVFRIWTTDGRMRAPVWRGLRPDRTPDEVVLDE